MADWGASGRRDSYEYRLVDPFSLQETGESVDTVQGESKLSFNYYGDVIASGTIVTDADTIDDKLVRVYHTASVGGEEVTEVLGTFFADSSTATAKHHAVKRTHACYSTLYRHTEDSFVYDFARTAGTNIVGEMRDIVEADGGHLRTLPGIDAGKQHTIDIWFEIGSKKGEALRTICGWCGWELGVDPYGYVTVGPYVSPRQKAVAYTFEDGAKCLYESGYDFGNTNADAINRCLAYFSRSYKQDPAALRLGVRRPAGAQRLQLPAHRAPPHLRPARGRCVHPRGAGRAGAALPRRELGRVLQLPDRARGDTRASGRRRGALREPPRRQQGPGLQAPGGRDADDARPGVHVQDDAEGG